MRGEVALDVVEHVGVGPELLVVEVALLGDLALDLLVELVFVPVVEGGLRQLAPEQRFPFLEEDLERGPEVFVDGGPHGAERALLALEADVVLDLELHVFLDLEHLVLRQGLEERDGRVVLVDVELVGVEDLAPARGVLEVELDDGGVEVLAVEPDVAFVADDVERGVGALAAGEVVGQAVVLHVRVLVVGLLGVVGDRADHDLLVLLHVDADVGDVHLREHVGVFGVEDEVLHDLVEFVLGDAVALLLGLLELGGRAVHDDDAPEEREQRRARVRVGLDLLAQEVGVERVELVLQLGLVELLGGFVFVGDPPVALLLRQHVLLAVERLPERDRLEVLVERHDPRLEVGVAAVAADADEGPVDHRELVLALLGLDFLLDLAEAHEEVREQNRLVGGRGLVDFEDELRLGPGRVGVPLGLLQRADPVEDLQLVLPAVDDFPAERVVGLALGRVVLREVQQVGLQDGAGEGTVGLALLVVQLEVVDADAVLHLGDHVGLADRELLRQLELVQLLVLDPDEVRADPHERRLVVVAVDGLELGLDAVQLVVGEKREPARVVVADHFVLGLVGNRVDEADVDAQAADFVGHEDVFQVEGVAVQPALDALGDGVAGPQPPLERHNRVRVRLLHEVLDLLLGGRLVLRDAVFQPPDVDLHVVHGLQLFDQVDDLHLLLALARQVAERAHEVQLLVEDRVARVDHHPRFLEDARELHRDLAVDVAAGVLRRDFGRPDLEDEVLQRGRRVDGLVHDRLLLAGQVSEDQFAFHFHVVVSRQEVFQFFLF